MKGRKMETITAKELEEKFNNNEEISDYMDFTNVKKLALFINEENVKKRVRTYPTQSPQRKKERKVRKVFALFA